LIIRTKATQRMQGFTLIELLTIVFILAVLASLMIPNIRRGVWKAKLAGCQSNLKNIATAVQVYNNDKGGGSYPETLEPIVPKYIAEIPECPSAGIDTYSEGYTSDNESKNYTLYCKGNNHSELKLSENEPWYSLQAGLRP
jgi:Tfp pilus assembly protein PilE